VNNTVLVCDDAVFMRTMIGEGEDVAQAEDPLAALGFYD
jgi:hypothetical protein